MEDKDKRIVIRNRMIDPKKYLLVALRRYDFELNKTYHRVGIPNMLSLPPRILVGNCQCAKFQLTGIILHDEPEIEETTEKKKEEKSTEEEGKDTRRYPRRKNRGSAKSNDTSPSSSINTSKEETKEGDETNKIYKDTRGHYYCECLDKSSKTWYTYNDGECTKSRVTEQNQELRERNGVLFIYERKK